jgi:hypothetical protein
MTGCYSVCALEPTGNFYVNFEVYGNGNYVLIAPLYKTLSIFEFMSGAFTLPFLAFAKLRKASINFVVPACPLRVEQLVLHQTDFHEI